MPMAKPFEVGLQALLLVSVERIHLVDLLARVDVAKEPFAFVGEGKVAGEACSKIENLDDAEKEPRATELLAVCAVPNQVKKQKVWRRTDCADLLWETRMSVYKRPLQPLPPPFFAFLLRPELVAVVPVQRFSCAQLRDLPPPLPLSFLLVSRPPCVSVLRQLSQTQTCVCSNCTTDFPFHHSSKTILLY